MADIVEKHIEKAKQMIDCTNLKEIRQFLRQVETEFDISICIKSSSHYSPMIFFDYVRAFLPFARSDDKDIVAAVLNFFDYFFPILITYSPIHFLDGCYEIYEIEQNPPNLCPILRYMALAINGQTIEVEEKYTPMILSILSSTSNADKELLFPFVWQSIAKQISLTECNALLEQMTTPNFGEAVAILAASHPQELISTVLTNSKFDFIKSFLSHLKTDYVIELDDYINTLAITNQPELLAAFINSNISLGEVSLDLAKLLCKNIASDITDYPAENRTMLLSALSNAVIRGLIDPADLKPAIDCKSEIEEYKRTSIKVLLTHLLDGFQQILEDIYENDSKALTYVINNLDISLSQMFDKDPKWTHDFVQKIITVKQSSFQILKIINKYPLTDLIGVDKIVYSNLNTTNIELAKLIFKISKKYGFQHSLASLDWILNPNISFEIIRSPDVQFTIELIHSSLSPPSALQGMLRALRFRPRAAAPLFFEELLSLAKLSVKPLRIFIDQEDTLPKINWISQMSINKLFFLSRAPFTHTQYGMFNLEIIRTFQEFFNYATNCNHMQCMILMRYLRLFATSFPETVVPLAIKCYDQ
ncbi:hypothetical protein TVAG_303000 [Trichomonas vaginalis G3]|uniref:Uncharacterized protein n=1 Tax=Trichomonas vaginalis (strain ATCC PRA-98 / G3) TaxID=412133 RepID=A2FZ00_TRIV3|nr:hypothetical protein TVAG_303000 [Trichomonas vaginalis G3]|eukprot:XP_001302793.1 hypothetical protein [Trichomonas vaginalis G3]